MEHHGDEIYQNRTEARPKDSELGFGKLLTDHMFLLDYTAGKGWHDARIVPYGPLRLDPAAIVLHYGQEVFEGLKAYHLKNGGVGLFRPEKNIERMNRSADRMVMPEIDPDRVMQAMKELLPWIAPGFRPRRALPCTSGRP